ncbi:WD40 repeat-like protein [Suillus decipiens]|nr:WD40 repeat-like protein [Suillus decipiens]
MFSGSKDKIARRWDLQSGKEIKEARSICEENIRAVAVSRNGQWSVTSGGDYHRPMLKAWEVETGTVKIFEGHSWRITCVDISADNTLLAGGSDDKTARIWNLKTGKLVAGPFDSADWAGAVRFSPDAKKLAVKSSVGKCLEVWDIRSQKLDVRVGGYSEEGPAYSPVFWTRNIIAAFTFNDEVPKTIYEFDASTLKTVGTPFEGHTESISSLALLFDSALLISASEDDTIKLWAFQSQQIIASFAFDYVQSLVSSPDSLQLAYTFYNDPNIYIRNATPALFAILPKTNVTFQHLLNSDATRRPAAARRTPVKRLVIFSPSRHQMPTMDNQQLSFFLSPYPQFFFTRTQLLLYRMLGLAIHGITLLPCPCLQTAPLQRKAQITLMISK